MQVHTKKIKVKGADGVMYEATERLGKITIQFDGERTDVAALANFIHGRLVRTRSGGST